MFEERAEYFRMDLYYARHSQAKKTPSAGADGVKKTSAHVHSEGVGIFYGQ